jgi:hypothetical protein
MKEVTMLKADGFDAAILGIGSRCGKPDILIYDYNKCCDILMERDSMTREEAIEFMDFNVVGAWHGENTPIFLYEIVDWHEIVGDETAH